ncbi:hypothetical protein BBJ28_00013681 [Nothophytophthora sp. Chile5]|nr:hypothetical protein BBJ28_00013681 [Nothophytophthora sp. Chile5]
MPINHSSKKRKSLFSIATPSVPHVMACGTGLLPPDTTPSPTAPTTPTSASTVSTEGANLSAALTALKVSLKRDFESFAPPTPAVSPAHGRGMSKRTRFDFGVASEDDSAAKTDDQRARAAPKTTNALLAVSNRIKFELEKRRRTERERAQRPRRRKQLSFFAIVGAFQRAAHERNLAMQHQPLEGVVGASTE